MNIKRTMTALNAKNFGRFAVLTALMLLVSACAGTGTKDDPLLERAQLRWDSLLSKDLDTAYSLYSPGYRSKKSRVDFEIDLRMQRVNWTSAEYIDRECSEQRCLMRYKIGFVVRQPVPGLDEFRNFSFVEETWIKTRGEWWYVPPKQ
jgi:hypothetical protein